jgi:hypothetical protein
VPSTPAAPTPEQLLRPAAPGAGAAESGPGYPAQGFAGQGYPLPVAGQAPPTAGRRTSVRAFVRRRPVLAGVVGALVVALLAFAGGFAGGFVVGTQVEPGWNGIAGQGPDRAGRLGPGGSRGHGHGHGNGRGNGPAGSPGSGARQGSDDDPAAGGDQGVVPNT